MLARGSIIAALKTELGDDPRSRMAIVYPASVPEMHGVASDLASELEIDRVIVDGRFNHHGDAETGKMLKEYEASGHISTLIIISSECILKLILDEGMPPGQWICEPVSLPQCAIAAWSGKTCQDTRMEQQFPFGCFFIAKFLLFLPHFDFALVFDVVRRRWGSLWNTRPSVCEFQICQWRLCWPITIQHG